MAKSDWQKIWAEQNIDVAADQKRLTEEKQTLRWQKMERLIKQYLGDFKNLKTIEVGAGLGDFSIILNELGAKTTLSDYSEEAIAKAKLRYQAHGLKADFEMADMLNVPDKLKNKFDLSMSFGLNEHFSGEDRYKITAAHAEVLRPGGLTFMSVPYKYAPHYQFWMRRSIKKGVWLYGLEIPFSRTEIRQLAEKAGLNTVAMFHSSFLGDVARFFPLPRAVRRLLNNHLEKANPLNRWGYALVYVGQKPKS